MNTGYGIMNVYGVKGHPVNGKLLMFIIQILNINS
jgi:hypothetical protein